MALSKSLATQYGVAATYWRVAGFESLDFANKQASFRVLGYKDKEAREENAIPLVETAPYTVTGDAFDSYVVEGDVGREALYTFLKNEEPPINSLFGTLIDFRDAVDA